jgi:hypothetical protein
MRRVSMSLGLAVLAGCVTGVGPADDVSGVWRAAQGSFGVTLELVQRRDSVTGSGAAWPLSFAIAGTYARPRLTLTFHNDTTIVARFGGTVESDSVLTGVETFVNGADTLTFVRQR